MKKLLVVFLSLTMILALSACASNAEEELYGIWTDEDVTFSNSSLVTEYELAAFETTYEETVLKLNEDKTGTLRYIGKDYDISWQLEEKTNLLIFIDGLLFTEIGVSDEGLALPVDTDKVFICVNLVKNNEYIDETVSSDSEDSPMTDIQPKSDMLIDTEYYTISVPYSWSDDCFYEIADGENYNYTLSFYDEASHEAINGGWLFTIDLLTEFKDYSHYPDYEVLGSLEVYRIGSYNIVVTYPTDVQFSEDTARKYSELSEKIPTILDSISFKGECTFSKEPIPIDNSISTPVSLSADFYVELYNYVIGSCVNYTKWWDNPTLSFTNPQHYYLGNITSENYDEKMNKAKQLVDNVYKTGYWEIRFNGYGTIYIGLYITSNDEVYFCYR